MIESPIVSTCIGAAAGKGTGGVAEGVAVGLGVVVLLEEAGGLWFGLDAAEGLVVVDRAPAAEVNATPVMREQQATVATVMAMPRDQLRVAEIDIGLPSVHQAVRWRGRANPTLSLCLQSFGAEGESDMNHL